VRGIGMSLTHSETEPLETPSSVAISS
jgi:hypothetical protein